MGRMTMPGMAAVLQHLKALLMHSFSDKFAREDRQVKADVGCMYAPETRACSLSAKRVSTGRYKRAATANLNVAMRSTQGRTILRCCCVSTRPAAHSRLGDSVTMYADFARQSVRAVAHIAQSVPDASGLIERLLAFLDMGRQHVTDQVITQLPDIIRCGGNVKAIAQLVCHPISDPSHGSILVGYTAIGSLATRFLVSDCHDCRYNASNASDAATLLCRVQQSFLVASNCLLESKSRWRCDFLDLLIRCRRFPMAKDLVINTVVTVDVTSILDPDARSSFLWMLGAYGSALRSTPYTLGDAVDNFQGGDGLPRCQMPVVHQRCCVDVCRDDMRAPC